MSLSKGGAHCLRNIRLLTPVGGESTVHTSAPAKPLRASSRRTSTAPTTCVPRKGHYRPDLRILTPNSVSRRWCSTNAAEMPEVEAGTHKIEAVSQQEDMRLIEVAWSAGDSSRYPYLWLRDNCQCEKCFHPVSRSRSNYLKDLDLQIEPVDIQVSQESNELLIKWSDGHVSTHDPSWLRVRAFETDFRARRGLLHKLPRKPWKAELPRVRWCDLLRSDEAVLSWIQLVETYGLVLITEAPKLPGCVGILADKVAFVRKTHYGEEFSVIAKPNPSNVAYSNAPLALHLDLPYYLHKPGFQLIHFIRQNEGEGGETQVSDAVQVAEHLRQVSPALFEVLATTPVDWMDEAREDGRDHFKLLKMPVICLDSDGKCVDRINFSQPQRDSFFSECPLEKVNDWYLAMKTFHDLLYDHKFCRSYKMESGSMMCLDNLRVTHGRTGYPDTATRHVEGCYMDWDEVCSRRRVLERRFGDFKG